MSLRVQNFGFLTALPLLWLYPSGPALTIPESPAAPRSWSCVSVFPNYVCTSLVLVLTIVITLQHDLFRHLSTAILMKKKEIEKDK
jgi:hypothetical protein